ncbi:1,4-dihydroxy-2-naphthoate octaprenyltransferase [Ktedonospora formicarum]|uniref:1,4-dihydroxy-2-naphthoate octaprenyltransferase n=1 Tax=Ktedonospora formicarum TaxID=2778364 RepID=A0A8J3MQH9_9CHLR|nr:1,4-dihydroxy-2-naphthoate octaprenyltransferase [Ktedonospora formicarum]GHO43990.1 hypothetical protein KSX_21530 [Ktedonospora formicarum]
MEKEEQKKQNMGATSNESKSSKSGAAAPIVDAVDEKAERLPTVPLESLKAIGELEPPAISVHSIESTRDFSVPTPLVVQPAEYHRTLGEWLRIFLDGVRPTYLAMSLFPFLFGSVLAWSERAGKETLLGLFKPAFVLGLVAVLLIHLGANLINDYYDYIRGVDTSNPLGPGGLIQQGLLKPTRILAIGLLFLVLGAIAGASMAIVCGAWLLALFGLVGLACAYFYSASSKSISSLCLGPVAALVIFGPLVTMSAYIAEGGSDLRKVFIYSLPFGLLAAASLLANDMRDLEGDEQAHKYTLANRLGLKWSRWLFLALLMIPYVIVAALSMPSHTPHWFLTVFWTLPLLVNIVSGVLRADNPNSLNLVFRAMLRQNSWFGLFMVLGLIVSTLISVLSFMPHLTR